MPPKLPDPDSSTSTTPQGEGKGEGREDVGSDQGAGGAAGSRRSTLFTSESARKARQVRADRERERNAAANEEARLSHLTARQRLGLSLAKLSQVDMDAVVQALANRAKNGEHQAVNALARLLDQSFGRAGTEDVYDTRSPSEKPWGEWSEAEKAQYRAALLAERDRLEAEHEAAGDSTDPRGAGVPSTEPDPD